jgi:hypothetical protein
MYLLAATPGLLLLKLLSGIKLPVCPRQGLDEMIDGGALFPMKIKDITEWSERWSTPSGNLEANAAVADGVLVGLSQWGTSIIGLAVQCPDGKYFASIRAPRNGYDQVLEFLKRNHGQLHARCPHTRMVVAL